MDRTIHSVIAVTILFGMATILLGQIFMDGDSTDWNEYPALIEAPDNQDSMFPTEVGAVVSDIVDIKTVKATVIGNVLFGYLEFWGGPAWPNNAYENDHEGTIYYESRGYYHLLLDIDNDATTGWSTDWYEAHYTPLGYLIKQGVPYEPMGAEVMLEWGARTNDDWKVANENADPIRNLNYWAADYEEYDGRTDLGSDYEIFNMSIPNADSTKVTQWQGSLKIDSSDDIILINDTLSSYWNGHAWGHSFLEFGIELTPFRQYYLHKDERSVLQRGDVIGVCGMTETPIDDWGVDMTTRGILTVGDVSGVSEGKPALVEEYNLANNYPNPFNSSTIISWRVGATSTSSVHVELSVHNLLGQKVATLVSEKQNAGMHSIVWDAGHLSSGVYYYMIKVEDPASRTGEWQDVKKMVLIR